jgi:hypothetical protein
MPSDFVNVRLSARGIELAGDVAAGGCVRINGGTYEFAVAPGETLRITRGEFTEIFQRATDEAGMGLFEEAPAVPPGPARPPKNKIADSQVG